MRTYDVIMAPSASGSWVLESEAKEVIAHHKYKRCLGNALTCSRNIDLCICDTPDWPRGNVPFWQKMANEMAETC